MLKLDGKTLSYDVAFTHNDINYPANWLRLASLDEKKAIGITEVANPPWYDQRFYWGADNPKALEDTNNYASYDKDGKGEGEVTGVTTGLKTIWCENQKAMANNLLSLTDWMVVRYAEATTVIPDSTKTYRAAVRTACGARETEINACTTVEELRTLVTTGKRQGTEKKDSDGKSFDPKQYNDILLTDWPS